MDYKNIKIAIGDVLELVAKTAKNFLDDYIDKRIDKDENKKEDTNPDNTEKES